MSEKNDSSETPPKGRKQSPKADAETPGAVAVSTTQSENRETAARIRAARERVTRFGRRSIRDYERIEIQNNRLHPLFRCFWRGEYYFGDEESGASKTQEHQGK